MKQKLLLLYIACCLFACKREPEEVRPNQHLYSYLSKEQLEKTPYFTNPAFDTLTFISNLNDTLAFVKTKTDSGFYEENFRDHPSGPTIYLYSQFIHNTYKTIKGEGSFWVRHSRKTSAGNIDILNFSIDGLNFSVSDAQIGRKGFYTYKELVEINGKIYKEIIIIYSTPSDASSNEAYINQSNGLFHVINKINNQKYTLIEK